MIEQVIPEAIEFNIEGLRLRGDAVPRPTIEAGKISIPA
jgi:hypothetical protein